jgi:glycosyltransferase involved in cell wall biosynthesis
MKKVLILSNTNENSPSIRYRLMYILNVLNKKREISYKLLSFFSKRTDSVLNTDNQLKKALYALFDGMLFAINILKNSYKYDVIIVKNYLFPIGGCIIEKVFYCLFKNKKILYDIDDAIYLNHTRRQNKIFSKFRNASEKVGFWTQRADKILVSNEVIMNDLMDRFDIPKYKFIQFLTCPYQNQYFNNGEEIQNTKNLSEVRFIWLGSPSTQKNLVIFSNLIKNLPTYYANVKIILMGTSDDFDLYRDLNHVEFIEWSLEREQEEMRIAHFGLNPLVNDTFEKRKSAFKVIQYYRAGIVPIVSDVGINKFLVDKYGGYCYNGSNDVNSYCFIKKILENYMEYSVAMYENTSELSVEYNKILVEKGLFGEKI